MPDPKFAKPWHGIPREEIHWNPTINEAVCIGCGTCVTGCGRLVYRFDFQRMKAVVYDPLNCLIACKTCANTCPTNAISFPPLETVWSRLADPPVHHHVEDELLSRKDQLMLNDFPPEEERKHLVVREIRKISPRNMVVFLRPANDGDCTCDFIPGQYMWLFVPGKPWLPRAYSIASAPKPDGTLELVFRRVEGGRFTTWAFERMKEGDEITAVGPMGEFSLKSPKDKPLLFVARGTGFAPIKAILEKDLEENPERDAILYWGVTDTDDFFDLDLLEQWVRTKPNFRVVLAARNVSPGFTPPEGIDFQQGTCYGALEKSDLNIRDRDVYVAGPGKTVKNILAVLDKKGVPKERRFIDSFGG